MSDEQDRNAVEERLRAAYPQAEFFGVASLDPIDVADHSPAWVGVFEEWQARLRAVLGGTVSRIEHIGSTAVPGLAAKPVVDVLVSVPAIDDEAGYRPHIESLGLPLRVREPGHRYFRAPGAHRMVQVHVCEAGGRWERDHLLFRDYLRAHRDAAADYARLKADLAQRFRNDRLGYTEGKSAFITAALVDAQRWARDTEWEVARA